MEKVIFESTDGISTIYFNRPESYNALDEEMLHQLLDILKKVEKNSDQVLIMAGKGKAFSAGGDIKMMQGFNTAAFNALMDTLSNIALTLYSMPKVVIAAIGGSAAGLGLSIALAADTIIVSEKAKLGMLFAGIGLIPDGGGHFFLQERIGTARAKQFIWSMEQVDAEQALQLGLADLIAENEYQEARKEASKVLYTPFKAIIRSKVILHQARLPILKNMLQEEKSGQLMATSTADHKEGIEAFLEKRPPHFTGK